MDRKLVLVVDDEPEVTFGLQAFFMAKGYEMLTALNGIDAMRQLRQHAIDLVLLDMKMPGVNGVEVLRFIHAESSRTKVIVITAYDAQFQERVERLGVDGFLMKPFGISALTSTVEQVLSGRHPSRSLPAEKVETSPDGPTPKAKLLFVEPSEYTYQLKEVFFTNPEKCGAVYEVGAAYSTEGALEKLTTFQPDILLVELSMVGPTGNLVVKAMDSPNRPKELIIHGSGTALPPTQNATMEEMTRHGVKVIYNESFTRAGLIRLGESVRKAAVSIGGMHASP